MAAGEYVSVHSQADIEGGDLERERAEIERDPAAERRELMAIDVAGARLLAWRNRSPTH